MMEDISRVIGVTEITPEEAHKLIESGDECGYFEPLGRFYLEEEGKFVGIDNSDGNAWTEEFPDKASCLRWLISEDDKE